MSDIREKAAEGAVYFIFGATGDLAQRKLFPALYSMYRDGKLGERFAVIGLARRSRARDEFRSDVYKSIQEFGRLKPEDEEAFESFASHFEYMPLDVANVAGYQELRLVSEQLERKFGTGGNRLFYLALAPEHFGVVSHNLKAGGMLDGEGWRKLVIEKPFGYDYETAEKLNGELMQVFREDQIYRIDHYLGKEMVQNIELIRFTNAFFEPLWNNKHIANVQITLGETVGVEDRGGYYDHSGALRDMGQNHMLQMVTMIAMEPPSRVHPEDIRDEKVKVLRSLRLYEGPEEVAANVVRGQYTEGHAKGKAVPGYRSEDKVNPASHTETYFAAKVYVDNLRWAGVPFYIRTGKRLPAKATEVVIEFNNVPENVLFARNQNLEPNLLVIRVQPTEGVYIRFNAKASGSDRLIVPVAMDFSQNSEVGLNTPEAYERLLFDAARGDHTHFTRWDEVALAWKFVDRIAEAWRETKGTLHTYPAGTWGPGQGHELLARDGFKWWPVGEDKESNAAMAVAQTERRE